MPVDLKTLGPVPAPAAEQQPVDLRLLTGDAAPSPVGAPREYHQGAPETGRVRWAPVRMSDDLRRIIDLPRRDPIELGSARANALVSMMTERYSRGPRACRCAEINAQVRSGKRSCLKAFNFPQAWSLYEIGIAGGLVASLPVGTGKTLLGLATPIALLDHGVKTSLLLVPPALVEQLKNDYALAAEHLRMPEIWFHDGSGDRYEQPGEPAVLHVLPYSLLSLKSHTRWIRNLNPDAIIADECDRLKDPDGAGTSRVMRHFFERGTAKFCGWTGSLTGRSLSEYFHLLALALGWKSPLPLDRAAMEEWGRAIDASPSPAPPGELVRLCEPGEDVRSGFARRLAETLGVIVYTAPSVDVELVIEEKPAPPIPGVVAGLLDDLRATWVRPDGEELIEALAVQATAQQLACGLYYQWWFPRGESVELIKEWLAARKDWNRELRRKLLDRTEYLDSPQLCLEAAQRAWGDRPNDRSNPLPEWKAAAWPRWREVRAKVKPKTRAVRVDDFLVQDAAQWAHANRGIVWYGMSEFGEWVAEVSGLPLHSGGPGAGARLVGGKHGRKVYAGEDGSRSIVCSIKSHGRGRDGLQHLYTDQLIANPPASASMWEQLLGRLHRQGAKAQTNALFYKHTPELKAAIDSALLGADYVNGTLRQEQKLRMGYQE